jgi:hypothetical protein
MYFLQPLLNKYVNQSHLLLLLLNASIIIFSSNFVCEMNPKTNLGVSGKFNSAKQSLLDNFIRKNLRLLSFNLALYNDFKIIWKWFDYKQIIQVPLDYLVSKAIFSFKKLFKWPNSFKFSYKKFNLVKEKRIDFEVLIKYLKVKNNLIGRMKPVI